MSSNFYPQVTVRVEIQIGDGGYWVEQNIDPYTWEDSHCKVAIIENLKQALAHKLVEELDWKIRARHADGTDA